MSGALSTVDVPLLNADVTTALWRLLASETLTPLSGLPVERVTTNCRLRTTLSVDQRPHRRTRSAICRTSSYTVSMRTWIYLPGAAPAMRLGLSPYLYKMSRTPPTMKHPGQESGCQLIPQFKILIVYRFMQSKSVNNVCKLLWFLGTSSPRSLTGVSLLDSSGNFCPPRPCAGTDINPELSALKNIPTDKHVAMIMSNIIVNIKKQNIY